MISSWETMSNKNTSLFYPALGASLPLPGAYFLAPPGLTFPVVTLDLILLISFLVCGDNCVKDNASQILLT